MTTLEKETNYCLESNFIIDLLNGKNNAVQLYEEIKNAPLAITAIASVALFEILRGEEKNQKKIQQFEELSKRLDILPFGEVEAKEASKVEKTLKNKGVQIKIPDLFIGITAKINGAVLITNDSDYKNIDGLNLLNY